MRIIIRIIKGLLIIALTCISLSVLWVFLYKYINPPITTMMLYKYFQQEEYQISQKWLDLEQISPEVPLAFIAAEDQLFLNHQGFDIVAIKKAYEKNKFSNKTVGASTISQQVAKNVFLLPNKSFVRKGIEAYFTVLIEWIWGKRRIMEVYINIVELGDGVYGAEAASRKFFNKSGSAINLNEAALMGAVLPNPILFSLKNPTPYMFRRKNWIINQMNNLGGQNLLKAWYE